MADAEPEISCAAVKTCLQSINAVELAAIADVVKIAIAFKLIVKVAAVAAVLVTTMFVTTVVVLAGVV
jgi:hypothetical protein